MARFLGPLRGLDVLSRPIHCLVVVLLTLLSEVAHAQTTVPGKMPGEFSVSNSGAAAYRIPIQVPPGVAGMEPKLAFVYNSQVGNGLMGMGWNLEGLSAITRCPKTLASDGMRSAISLTPEDRFCLDGQRLINVAGVYGAADSEYRTEIDSFSKVIANSVAAGNAINGPESFTVKTKAGLTLEYGSTADSRIEAQGKDVVRLWSLSKIRDAKGNEILYLYDDQGKSSGEFNLNTVAYGATTPLDSASLRRIVLNYESRPDFTRGYEAGSQILQSKRLISTSTFVGSTVLQTLVVSYAPVAGALRYVSRIEKLTLCESGACLPSLQLRWLAQDDSPFWKPRPNLNSPWHLSHDIGNISSIVDTGAKFVDVNGDGILDLIFNRWRGLSTDLEQKGAYIGNGENWTYDSRYVPPWHLSLDIGNLSSIVDTGAKFIDVNGDGLVDMVYNRWRGLSWDKEQKGAYINTGSGWVRDDRYTPPWHLSHDIGNLSSIVDTGAKFIDVNGDGLIDMVYNRWRGLSGDMEQKGAYINTGSGWVRDDRYVPPWHLSVDIGNLENIVDTGAKFIDVNGDGLVDMVYSRWRGLSWDREQKGAFINTGSGWARDDRYIPPWHLSHDIGNLSSIVDTGAKFIDVNGDGLVDMVYSRWRGLSGDMEQKGAYINTGAGWMRDDRYAPPWHLSLDIGNLNSIVDTGAKFIDVNGDGLVDMVYSRWRGLSWDMEQKGSYINTGSGWARDDKYTPPWHLSHDIGNLASIVSTGGHFEDFNGDGQADLTYFRWRWMGSDSNKQVGTFMSSVVPLNLLTTISSADNIVDYRIEYGDALRQGFKSQEPATHPDSNLMPPHKIVVRVSKYSGSSSPIVTNFAFGGWRAELARGAGYGRGNLGFRWMKKTEVDSGIETYSEFAQAWPFTGIVTRSETRKLEQGGPRLLKQTEHAVDCYLSATVVTGAKPTSTTDRCNTLNFGSVYFPFIRKTSEYSWDISGTQSPTITTYYYYSGYFDQVGMLGQFGDLTKITVDISEDGQLKSRKTVSNAYHPAKIGGRIWETGRLARSIASSLTEGGAGGESIGNGSNPPGGGPTTGTSPMNSNLGFVPPIVKLLVSN